MEKKALILIEDNLDHIELIREYLDETGFFDRVTTITNGEEGLQFLIKCQESLENRPHLALLDINLPRVNGLEVLEKYCEIYNGPPIIVMSTSNNPQDRERALKLGATCFVQKTLPFGTFLENLYRSIHLSLLKGELLGTP